MIINQTGGGGLSLNGVLQQYGVAADKIEAGDFVNYINGMHGAVDSGSKSTDCFAFPMSAKKIFCLSPYGKSSYANIIDYSTIPATSTTSVNVYSGTLTSSASHNATVQIDDATYVAFYKDGASGSTQYVHGIVIKVEGTTITVGDTYQLSTTASSSSAVLCATALKDGRIFVVFNDTTTDLKAMVVTASGTVLSCSVSPTTFSTMDKSSSGVPYVGTLDSGKAFAIHGGTSDYGYITVFTVGTNSITAESTTCYSTKSRASYAGNFITLDSNRIFVATSSGAATNFCGVVLYANGSTVTTGGFSGLIGGKNNGVSKNGVAIVQQADGTLRTFHRANTTTYELSTAVVSIDNLTTTIVEPSTVLSEESASGNSVPVAVVLGENKWFILHPASIDEVTRLAADFYLNGVIKATESPADGVATINGKVDDTIDVYVPA